VNRREDIPEAELLPRKRLCPTAPTSRYEVEENSTHTQMHDYRIPSQESLMTTLIAQVSSLQGQLSAALG
ncbi:hypothetical protein Tco_0141750, partial [Tanacetum coccineum]